MAKPSLQNALVEAYRLTYKLYGKASLEKARAICRAIGLTFTNAEASRLLEPFIKKSLASRNAPESGRLFGRNNGREITRKTDGIADGRTDSRAVKEPLSLSLSSETSSPHTPAKRGGAVRGMKLPFDLTEKIAAKAICKAIWPELQPHLGRAFTITSWTSKQMRVATDLAKLGWTPEQVLEKWRTLCRERGEAVVWLSVVQNALAKQGASAPIPAARAAPGSRISAADYEDKPLPGSPLYRAENG